MSKQTAIEQDGTIVETLPNAMFKVELRMVMLSLPIFQAR